MRHGKHDAGLRRRATRAGRQRGCSIYIPAEQLQAAGIDPNADVPWYRTWPGERGRFVVTLYREA